MCEDPDGGCCGGNSLLRERRKTAEPERMRFLFGVNAGFRRGKTCTKTCFEYMQEDGGERKMRREVRYEAKSE